jgi:lipoprotein NlpI
MLRLWLIKSRFGERKNADRELEQYLAERNGESNKDREPTDWYSRLSWYLLGKLPEKKFFDRKTLLFEGRTESEGLCELYFYMGMKNLFDGNGKQAFSYFENALKTNVIYYTEFQSAKTEYARLSSTTPPQIQK